MTKDELTNKISWFLASQGASTMSESKVASEMREIDSAFPHAQFIGILAYPDRDRTPSEMADEVFLREEIFREGGKASLNEHIKGLYTECAYSPNATLAEVCSAVQILEGIEGKELPDLRELAIRKFQN